MSEKDEVKPFHAKETASGQEAADAVAAVLKHAKERDAAAKQTVGPKKQPKWLLPVGINLAVFAAYLLIGSPSWVVLNPIDPPPTAERVQSAGAAIVFNAQKIENFRASEGRLPANLAEAGVNADDFEYALVGAANYVLFVTIGDREVAYRSAQQTLREFAEQNARGMRERIGG